jgi:hypothetical protein
MNKSIQAKHISDKAGLEAILACGGRSIGEWATLWDIHALFPIIPHKVVTAKMAALVRRGLAVGCVPCGCRGDLWVTAAGYALLAK